MSQRRDDAGHALLLVLLLGTLFAGLWVIVHRATRDAATVQIASAEREAFEERITRALLFAGDLLEAGRPTRASYQFVYAGQYAGDPFFTTVTLQRVGGQTYDADARPATTQEIARLPQNPRRF